MSIYFSFILLTLLSFSSCRFSEDLTENIAITDKQSPGEYLVENEPIENLPEPGSATQTSTISTPLQMKENIINYQDENGDKLVVLSILDDEIANSYVIIRKNSKDSLKLSMTEAWAKGANYSDGKNTWAASGNTATFTRNGKSQEYKIIE